MVGSMNAASKFTKGEGEEEQLGGTVYTKNLKDGMKMPAKIIEGRNNWLLMEKDTAYEDEDIGENCESNFDHFNEMSNIMMPRDFLAKLTRYFIRLEGESMSFFQDAQREACEIMVHWRPHWRKRKSKSGALFISVFFLIEKEVAESEDEISKELFVEAFGCRDDFIDILMKAMDRVDEVEAAMTEGMAMKMPAWIYGEGEVGEEDRATQATQQNEAPAFDINKLVLDTLDIIKDLDIIDKTKYVKVFHNNDTTLAIQHTKVKSLAKEKGLNQPKFLAQKKNYPSFVTLKTETFTKMSASANSGSTNTGPGFCTSIILSKLSAEVKLRVSEDFGLSTNEMLLDGNEDDAMDIDPTSSQDYPEFSQSQNSETLKVCEICHFKTRSKFDFNNHMEGHPKCPVCKKTFKDKDCVAAHMEVHQTAKCSECGLDVAISSMRGHMANHELTEHYKTGLNKPTKKTKTKNTNEAKGDQPTKLNSYQVFCRLFREEKKRLNPTLNMLGINEKLREHWHSLSPTEKAAYKTSNVMLPSAPPTPLPSDSPTVASLPLPTSVSMQVAVHTLPVPIPSVTVSTASSTFTLPDSVPSSTVSSTASGSVNLTLQRGQTTIHKCSVCGKMFLNSNALDKHKGNDHGLVVIAEDLPGNEDDQIEPEVSGPLAASCSTSPSAGTTELDSAASSGSSITQVFNNKDNILFLILQIFQPIQWVKLRNIFWPCRINVERVGQEVMNVTIFDDKNTTIDVEVVKLKLFTLLEKIPRARTAEWKRGYARAAKEFQSFVLLF